MIVLYHDWSKQPCCALEDLVRGHWSRVTALCVALHFAISGGRPSKTDFAAAVTTVLVVLFGLAQPGSASSEDSASEDSARSDSSLSLFHPSTRRFPRRACNPARVAVNAYLQLFAVARSHLPRHLPPPRHISPCLLESFPTSLTNPR